MNLDHDRRQETQSSRNRDHRELVVLERARRGTQPREESDLQEKIL